MYENSSPKERPLNQKASTKPNEDSGKDPITNVASFLQKISKIPKDSTVLYRGHADEEWELTPAIGRMYDVPCKKGAVPQKERILLKKEKRIFLDFKSQYHLYADDRPSTDIDTLFLAQHYGLPTRLLDWSYNPLVALWNACQDAKENKDGCIHIVQISQKNVGTEEGHDLDNDIFGEKNKELPNYQFLIPDYTNRRFLNQKGMFLWFKNPQEEYKDECCKKYITIKHEHKKDILQELSYIGVDEAFIYPDLEHLCKDIKKNYLK